MKVLSAECYGGTKDLFELEILKYLTKKNPDHPGWKYVATLLDFFAHTGPNGQHICLVSQVMAESFQDFGKWFPKNRIPSPVVQRFTMQLLQGLEYSHGCGVVHTGK